MRRKILILVVFAVLILCSCSGTKKKAIAPDDIPDDLVAVLPSGDEIYIYMARDSAEELIEDQGTQDSVGVVNYEDLDLHVGYLDNKLVYIAFGRNSKIQLKSGISVDTKFNELDSDFDTLDGEKVQHSLKRFIHDNGKFTRINENAIKKAQPFEFTNLDVYFSDGGINQVAVFDLYAGSMGVFDK